jgi:Rrf2 family nitric oxide-sensitive transcriptional repressor
MRLTTYSDYALRLLMYAAVRSDSQVTIGEVSRTYGISKNHLMKIVHHLSTAGLLETTRGRNGGLRLAKPAQEIRIGQVVRLTEQGGVLVECFDAATNACAITRSCRLKHMLHHALEDFFTRLDRYSLADLVDGGGGLALTLPSSQPG